MSNRPWMPLYIADFHADTMHLNAAETGAYLLLIMHYWQRGKLPVDEGQLARIARLSRRDWGRYRATLKAFFHGRWKHKRIDKELAQVIERSQTNSANARLSHINRTSKPRASAPANADTLHTSHSDSEVRKKDIERAPEKPLRRKPKTTFPEDFALTDERRSVAVKNNITSARVLGVFERFKNHHTAKGSEFADWDAAWRYWCGRDSEFHTTPNGNGNGQRTSPHRTELQLALDKAREFAARGDPEFAPVPEDEFAERH